MSGFSTASLDAICVPVSSRALSAAGTLDDVAARLPSDPHESTTALEGLSELSKVLKRFGESVECLREALSKATVISGMLQTALVASLQTSEQGIAVIERNVAAVQISKGRVPLPEATVQIYRRLVDQLAQVVALLIGLLGRLVLLTTASALSSADHLTEQTLWIKRRFSQSLRRSVFSETRKLPMSKYSTTHPSDRRPRRTRRQCRHTLRPKTSGQRKDPLHERARKRRTRADSAVSSGPSSASSRLRSNPSSRPCAKHAWLAASRR